MDLKIKSGINLKAAGMLSNRDDINICSVHCSYYSCYQYIIHCISEITKLNDIQRRDKYEEHKEECKRKGESPMGSHEFWLNQFYKYAITKDFQAARHVFTKTEQLKSKRIDADYSDKIFTKKETSDLANCAKSIIDSINLIMK